MDVQFKEDESHSTSKDSILAALGIITSKRLLERGVEQTAGVQRFVHGTNRDAQKAILQQGLLPSKGGNPQGGAGLVDNKRFLSGSKGRVHVAKDNFIGRYFAADPHAALAEAGRLARESGKKLSLDEARKAYNLGMLLPSFTRFRTQVGGAMPYADFARKFEQDPDHIPGIAFRTKSAIPAGNLAKNRAGIFQILKAIDFKGILPYLKQNPRRALGGAASLVASGLVANQTAKPAERLIRDLKAKYDGLGKAAGWYDAPQRWTINDLILTTTRDVHAGQTSPTGLEGGPQWRR